MKKLLSFAFLCILVSACGSKPATMKVDTSTGDILETQTVQVLMKNGKTLTDPDHGKEVAFWYGAVNGENGAKANGVVYIHKFEDGASVFTVNVNIEMLKSGYYTAWLASDASGTNAKLMGPIPNLFKDVRHSLRYESKMAVSGSPVIVITKEQTQTPSKPGAIVATALVKETATQ